MVFSQKFKFGFGLYIFTFPNFNLCQLIAFRFLYIIFNTYNNKRITYILFKKSDI